MAVSTRFHPAGLSDPGRRRENNEDRFHSDQDRGIYFVIDGVGGQAAGEKAADTAHELLRARLERPTGTVPVRIREAIALANNEIYRLAQTNDDWHGMACVLTVAVIENDELHIGQVGDSRLYLIQPGEIRKLTHDHSPVGEREDRGEIDEMTAMRHPRRNEVYRDVGTTQHSPDDPDFIEVGTHPLPTDGVLLLCSDGLSDLVTSKQILSTVEANAGAPEEAARELIAAANEAGGKDNITVVLVEGPRFAAGVRRRTSSRRTTIPIDAPPSNPILSRWAFLAYGILLSMIAVYALRPHWISDGAATTFGLGLVHKPRVWRVANDINSAIQAASPGDTILVAPGTYNEQLRLRDGIQVVSEQPRLAILRSNGSAVSGEDMKTGRFEGFRIQPDDSSSLQIGIQVTNSAIDIVDNFITGTVTAGIELTNSVGTTIRANRIQASNRAAIVVDGDGNGPRIVGNDLTTDAHPGVVITGNARPVMSGNVIHGPEGVFAPPQMDTKELDRENTVIKPQTPAGGRTPARPTNAPPRVR
ncbi:MAG: protein phosphatase 2C domain-containing protein, partial [Bryobacteraceae bacterium]|nr:protein phosphatase 2C domain-containing protein [Bryobacteraceae bacterium]